MTEQTFTENMVPALTAALYKSKCCGFTYTTPSWCEQLYAIRIKNSREDTFADAADNPAWAENASCAANWAN